MKNADAGCSGDGFSNVCGGGESRMYMTFDLKRLILHFHSQGGKFILVCHSLVCKSK